MRIRGFATWTMSLVLLVTAACAAAAQESVIYGFSGSITGAADGSTPYDGLISDAKGNLYGTTSAGGASTAITTDGEGTVFELTPTAGGGWTEKVLYSFGATATDGIAPYAGLVFDAKGNLYGTTSLGGANGLGTAFELTPGTGGVWTERVLYSFGATSTDASQPKRGSLIFDAKGNIYGTTRLGGPNSLSNGGGLETGGTVYELSPGTGGAWTEKVLYNFGATSTDAANPVAGLVMDATGNLYGTTLYGGVYDLGTVFELTPAAGDTWTETILHSFDLNGTDGTLPYDGLIFDPQGNLYGTTYGGGSNPSFGGSGTVFELTPAAGGTWTEQVLHSFSPFTTDGDYPYGGLVFDAAGNLYGTTSSRLYGYGIVFELTPAADGWTENILHFFGGNPDGQGPLAGVIFDAAGNLYGTTSTGGPNGLGLAGTVFEIAGVTVANPQFSPAPGAYSEAQTVTITDTTPGATIYYTINGGTSPTKYTASFEVSESSIIMAYATSPTLPRSQVTMAGYQIGSVVATPEFSPGTGTYSVAQAVTITDAAPGATIYYTTNGAAPTTSSTKYAGPIDVSSTETIEAIAVASGYANSTVSSATYTIEPAAASPIFTPGAGTYTSPQLVTITDATSATTIYYTTNGTTPTTSSTKYAAAIAVSTTETIKAIAVATGFSQSAVAAATYTINSTTTGSGLQFIPVTPCRVADTRNATGPFGGPEMSAGTSREFDIPQSACGIPSTGVAYSLNVTVVPDGFLNYLTLWPSGQTQPYVSTLNSDGRVKANAAITPAGTNGGVSVFVSDATQVIVDIDGYFMPAGTASALAFYPLTPCRVADTRQATGPLGGPSISGGSSRAFPVQSSSCGIPSTAKAYSLNVTAVPHTTLNYLTTWPTGETQPYVSTLNSSTGAVVANAAIVPAGTSGDISIFVSDTSDVILDVNGYFAPPATGGLSLYPVSPCRVIDTRSGAGAFNGVLSVDVETSSCAPPATAQGYVLNATVVPPGSLNYLTLWPAGETQPYVSTLNADDGAITSNMAIVPTTNGSIDAFSSNSTDLILDLSSYFAP